jgi:hypothetical protein
MKEIMLETRKFVKQEIPYFVALRLFLAARLAFTLVLCELQSETLLRIGNPLQGGQRNVK